MASRQIITWSSLEHVPDSAGHDLIQTLRVIQHAVRLAHQNDVHTLSANPAVPHICHVHFKGKPSVEVRQHVVQDVLVHVLTQTLANARQLLQENVFLALKARRWCVLQYCKRNTVSPQTQTPDYEQRAGRALFEFTAKLHLAVVCARQTAHVEITAWHNAFLTVLKTILRLDGGRSKNPLPVCLKALACQERGMKNRGPLLPHLLSAKKHYTCEA